MKLGIVLCSILELLFASEPSACITSLQMRTLVEMDGSEMVPLLVAVGQQEGHHSAAVHLHQCPHLQRSDAG